MHRAKRSPISISGSSLDDPMKDNNLRGIYQHKSSLVRTMVGMSSGCYSTACSSSRVFFSCSFWVTFVIMICSFINGMFAMGWVGFDAHKLIILDRRNPYHQLRYSDYISDSVCHFGCDSYTTSNIYWNEMESDYLSADLYDTFALLSVQTGIYNSSTYSGWFALHCNSRWSETVKASFTVSIVKGEHVIDSTALKERNNSPDIDLECDGKSFGAGVAVILNIIFTSLIIPGLCCFCLLGCTCE